MLLSNVIEIAIVVTVGAAVAVAIVMMSGLWFGRKQVTGRQLLLEVEGMAAFIFDRTDLLDASDAARAIIAKQDHRGTDWDTVLTTLKPSFPNLVEELAHLPSDGQVSILSADARQRLEAEHWDGLVRITLIDTDAGDEGQASAITVAALEDELATLRALAEDTPQLIWRLDNGGEITWANRAYLDLAMTLDGRDGSEISSWPPRHVFDQVRTAPLHGEPTRRRVPIPKVKGGPEVDWFEVTSMRRGAGSVHFATDANGLVRAEQVQREFVQTLTKTFAQLSTALIIFDRHRRLVLFNPAFLDMSGLPIEFLSARPVIQSVLDKLREAHILPEPKDYSSWRDQMSELESAAKDGTYSENWTLPTGQTFRVTGRPHPDGAIAFLFEDISSEVSLTRRFRSELEFGQAVIDNIDEAVVVFSSSGAQIASNRRYGALWDLRTQPDDLTEVTIDDALKLWRSLTTPSPTWGDLRDFVREGRDRAEWAEKVQMADGRTLACRIVPLVGGATMVCFRVMAPDALAEREALVPIGLARANQ